MNLCPGVEINFPFAAAFPENDAGSLVEVYIRSVQFDQFSNTHPGGSQQFHHCQVANFRTSITQNFNGFVGKRFFNDLCGLDPMDTPHRTFNDIIFILKPGKKAGENPAYIVNSNLADIPFLLVFCQIQAKIVGINQRYFFFDPGKEATYCFLIINDRFPGTAFYLLCRNKHGQQAIIRFLCIFNRRDQFGDLVFLQTAPHSGHQLFFLAIAQFSVHSLLNFLH